jgi:transketolase
MHADMKPTRFGFGECLDKEGCDERVVCLGADISGSICILDFCKKHEDRKPRFISVGIAEQNMTTVAAGLAKEGKIPVIGSYGVFSTGRNWDQIRTTVCYGGLNVKIAVGHGGVSVGPDGATHQALEDITITSIIPNMTVLVPCDAIEAYKATHAGVFDVVGPTAMRFARESTPVVTKPETPFALGKANVARFKGEKNKFADAFEWTLASEYETEGERIAIIACGPEVPEAMRAVWILEKQHKLKARVVNVHTVKPIDEEAIVDAANECDVLVTAEEHQAGGLGNIVAGVIARSPAVKRRPRIAMVGVQDKFGETGQPWELVWKFGLAGEFIAQAALELLRK